MDAPPGLVVRFNRPNPDDGRHFTPRLDVNLLQCYPTVEIHGLHPPGIPNAHLTFLVASIDGPAMGCGALRSDVRRSWSSVHDTQGREGWEGL